MFVEQANRVHDFAGRASSLHFDGRDYDVDPTVAPPEHMEHIAQRGPARRGYYPDASRQQRQLPLARLVEQALGRESSDLLLERELQRADAQRLHDLDDELIFPARLINGQTASQPDFEPVLRLEAHQPVPLPVEDRAQLRLRILQREIPMA